MLSEQMSTTNMRHCIDDLGKIICMNQNRTSACHVTASTKTKRIFQITFNNSSINKHTKQILSKVRKDALPEGGDSQSTINKPKELKNCPTGTPRKFLGFGAMKGTQANPV